MPASSNMLRVQQALPKVVGSPAAVVFVLYASRLASRAVCSDPRPAAKWRTLGVSVLARLTVSRPRHKRGGQERWCSCRGRVWTSWDELRRRVRQFLHSWGPLAPACALAPAPTRLSWGHIPGVDHCLKSGVRASCSDVQFFDNILFRPPRRLQTDNSRRQQDGGSMTARQQLWLCQHGAGMHAAAAENAVQADSTLGRG